MVASNAGVLLVVPAMGVFKMLEKVKDSNIWIFRFKAVRSDCDTDRDSLVAQHSTSRSIKCPAASNLRKI